MNSFRTKHLIALLEMYEREGGALDFFVSRYFRHHTSLGSKDRAYISDTVYTIYRLLELIDCVLKKQKRAISWQERVFLIENTPDFFESYQDDISIPLHVRLSFPRELFDVIIASYGETEAVKICRALNARAPTAVRANALKITRDELLSYFQSEKYKVIPGSLAATAIVFEQKINFFTLKPFTEGLFEVQDESSQQAALLAPATEGDEVLDYCAGSGGKALAIAPKLKGKGQIYLHDVRKRALVEAKKRLKRAGIQNAQVVQATDYKRLSLLEGRMNLVFVDAPCSGTGTLRRNPDMKWKFSKEMVADLVKEQREIFRNALRFVGKRGKIVYATCSILNEENEEQVAFFEREYGLTLEAPIFKMVPERNGPDGFFAAVFKRVEGQ